MSRSFKNIFEVGILAYVFILASKPLNDPDFWFHLKTGEYIVLNGLIPRTDPFSFTFNGHPWIAHGWLSGLIFYLIQSRLGFGALIFLFALLITLAFWFVFRRCNAHPLISGIAVLIGVLSMSTNIGVRPRVFTILLSSIFLYILGNYARRGEGKWIWILVPLTALWVNLHGGYFIGLALMALTMTGIILDKYLGGEQIKLWPRLGVLSAVMAGSVLAILANPYGAAMPTVPIRVLQSPVYKQIIVDWLSPDFHRPEVLPFLLLLLLTTAALALSPVRPKPSEVVFFLATLYATLASQRNMTIFALVAVPLFANYTQHWLNSNALGTFLSKSTILESRGLGLLFLLPLVLFAVQLRWTVYGEVRQQTMDVPVRAVDHLKQNQIFGNTFTEPNIWANYLIWSMPSNPVYIDGRDVYPERFVAEYAGIVFGTNDWREAFDRYEVQVAIVGPRSLLARRMRSAGDWQEVYHDEMAIVFSRRALRE
jgi:hypothetical protein